MSNVSDIKRKPITLELDKPRVLRYTLNAFAEMEERYGSVQEALNMVEKNNMKAIIFMLWCGLMHEDELLTERQVGNMIDITELQDISDKMGLAMQGDMPNKATNATAEIAAGTSPNA